jgi:prepilin-type N-terminal cleavage/methylation domain-containing protein/prepilin-type processing-associated H-X9-DG protein
MMTLSSTNSLDLAGRVSPGYRRGFTLTELLVVIGIIGILLGISFPAMQMIRQTARRTYCSSNLRQVMIATLAHESNGNGFPRADNGRGGSFLITLLPHIEEQMLHDRARMPLDTAIGETYSERLQELSNSKVDLFICPAAQQPDIAVVLPLQGNFTTHYYGVAGPIGSATSSDGTRTYTFQQLTPPPVKGPIGLKGLFSPRRNGKFNARQIKDITDGTSNTFALGENSGYQKDVPDADSKRSGWAFGAGYDVSGKARDLYGIKSLGLRINQPGNDLNTLPFSSNHPGGTHFAFVDGSIHFIEDEVSVDVLKTFASIDQGEKQERLEE